MKPLSKSTDYFAAALHLLACLPVFLLVMAFTLGRVVGWDAILDRMAWTEGDLFLAAAWGLVLPATLAAVASGFLTAYRENGKMLIVSVLLGTINSMLFFLFLKAATW